MKGELDEGPFEQADQTIRLLTWLLAAALTAIAWVAIFLAIGVL